MKAFRERTETEASGIELREDGDKTTLIGLGVPYGKWSEKLGWFTERIHKGASTKTLRESKDIALIYNHNNDKILSRTSAGNLTLKENDSGVNYESGLDDQSYAKDLVVNVRNKNIQGNSFGFTVPEGKEKWTEQGERVTRDIYEIRLFEMGPQVFPAYSQTKIGLRGSIFENDGPELRLDLFQKAFFFAEKGLTFPANDADDLLENIRCFTTVLPSKNGIDIGFITDFICRASRKADDKLDQKRFEQNVAVIRSFIPAQQEPEPEGHHSDADPEPDIHSGEANEAEAQRAHAMWMRRKKLKLLELSI